jgi:serine phosphatase RsbU (regulator of sigma subunit)/ketosteroid isomerase-like protein
VDLLTLTEVVSISTAVAAVCLAFLLARERKSRRRFRILADIAAVSESSADLDRTFEAICDILVPEIADFCMIDVIADGGVRRAAVGVGPGGEAWVAEWLERRRPSTPEHMLEGERGPESMRPRFYERMSDELLRELAQGPEDLEAMRSLAPRSTITVALNARGKVTGALTLGTAWSKRRYRRDDARFAWILSGRVALALDNSGLFADLERAEQERTEIAETLQRGLLPPPLPHIPGWSVAAMYRPAGAQNEVGGDFYDVFRVPGGWMLAIGDVTGRGAQAASITAVARYTLRTAALLTDDPIVALATLNRALLVRGDAALCSVAVLVLSEDPAQPVRLAVAGHPPPLLVDGSEVVEVAPSDPVLGAFSDSEWDLARSKVEPGRHLVVVTDGITEAQGDDDRFGEERLRETLRGANNPGLALQRLEGAVQSFADGRLDDDVAIVSVARQPQALGDDRDHPDAALIQRLYDGFNDRDEDCIRAVCDEQMGFYPIVTAEITGREAPYVGPAGLRDYLDDVAQVWEELQIVPGVFERRGGTWLIRGRVYARSRELGIRDVPVAWIWEIREGRIVRGEVFTDPEQATARFELAAA